MQQIMAIQGAVREIKHLGLNAGLATHTGWVILGKVLNLAVPQCVYLQDSIEKRSYIHLESIKM